MKRIFTIVFILLSAVLIQACSGSKSYSKRAEKLEEAGLFREAANNYFTALQKNPKNTDAQIGLKKTGERVINDLGATFYQAHQVGQVKDAVYTYRKAQDFITLTKKFVQLKLPAYYDAYYEESKQKYLDIIYEKANIFLEEQKFNPAQVIFQEISNLDPAYKDVKSLLSYSTIEPMYREGVKLFEAKKFRLAYYKLSDVIKREGDYKEAAHYRDEALKEATVTVAFIPPTGKRKFHAVEKGVSAKIVQQLVNSKNPFIKVVDREHTDKIINEQHLGLSGVINEETAAQAGELLGAKVLLTGKILGLTETKGTIVAEDRKGYRAYSVKKTNPETKESYTETKYAKAKYKEYQGESKVGCSYEFRLISAETGEVIASDVFNSNVSDRVSYARYEGENKNLYPGTWKFLKAPHPTDKVNTSRNDKKNLDALLNSPNKALKKNEDLKLDIANDLSKRVADRVNQYNPEQ